VLEPRKHQAIDIADGYPLGRPTETAAEDEDYAAGDPPHVIAPCVAHKMPRLRARTPAEPKFTPETATLHGPASQPIGSVPDTAPRELSRVRRSVVTPSAPAVWEPLQSLGNWCYCAS
jgi:hypothetical protein